VKNADIAAAAGVAEGTVFRVFADKDELLLAALDAVLDPEPLERALAAIDPSLTFEARLVAATEVIQRRVVDVSSVVSHLSPRLQQHSRRPLRVSDELTALQAAEPQRLRIAPADAARMLRAMT
jgi:AcrR family transcriptional regulator